MRRDSDRQASSPNGSRHCQNSSTLLNHQKSPYNGSANGSANGSSHLNGNSSSQANGTITNGHHSSSFFGHDRGEVARLLIQALRDLGYHDSSNALVRESGYELESPSVAAFRRAILDGEWSEAESLLFGTSEIDEGGGVSINGHSNQYEPLPLAEGTDKQDLRFRLRRQKYLELLEERDHPNALVVLRQELTPLHRDVGQLHVLSG